MLILRYHLTTFVVLGFLACGPVSADLILLAGDESPITATVLDCDESFLTVQTPSGGPDGSVVQQIPVQRLDPHYHYVVRSRLAPDHDPSTHLALGRLCLRLGLARLAHQETHRALRLVRTGGAPDLLDIVSTQLQLTAETRATELLEDGRWRRSFGRWKEAGALFDEILLSFPSTPAAVLAAAELRDMEHRLARRASRRQRQNRLQQEHRQQYWKRAISWVEESIERAQTLENQAFEIPVDGGRPSRLKQVDRHLTHETRPRLVRLHTRAEADRRQGILPEGMNSLLERFEERVRTMRIHLGLELARLHLARGNTAESTRWAGRVLELDPDNMEARELWLLRVTSGQNLDPFRMTRGLLTRRTSRRPTVDGPTLRAVQRRLTTEEIEAINEVREADGLNPLPNS